MSCCTNSFIVLDVMALFFEKISLKRFTMGSGISPSSSMSSANFASVSMQSVCRVFAPCVITPSRRLLSNFLRIFRWTGLAAFSAILASFTISLPHGVQSKPPSGPALLYGVTVKRLSQSSQFSSCPGSFLAFLYMSITSKSESSSSEPPFFFFFGAFFLAAFPFLILAMASSWSRLRFRERFAAIAEDSSWTSSSSGSSSAMSSSWGTKSPSATL